MGERPYVVIGSVWLMMAVILRLGQKVVRQWPDRYTFFGVGGWLTPAEYWFLVVACVVIGVALVFHKKHA